MIQSELAARISALNPHLYTREVEKVVKTILGRIAEALVAGDRVELRGLGAFSVRAQAARSGRNPRTGARVAVEAKTSVHFKPGKEMKARINPQSPPPTPRVRRRSRTS